MIKRFNLEWLKDDNEYERIYNIIKDNKYDNLFKFDGDESIFFKEENEQEILTKLGLKRMYDVMDLSDYIQWFDGGQYVTLSSEAVTINECINQVLDNLKKYEDRILNAKDIQEEIEQILKEQIKPIYEEHIKKNYIKIQNIINGNFNWE